MTEALQALPQIDAQLFRKPDPARLLTAMGAEVRIFNPSGLPLPDDAPDSHPSRWPRPSSNSTRPGA